MPDTVAVSAILSIHDRNKVYPDTLKVDFLLVDIHHNRAFQRLSLCTIKGIEWVSEVIILSLTNLYKNSISPRGSDDIYLPSMNRVIRGDDIVSSLLEVSYRDYLASITDLTFRLGHSTFIRKDSLWYSRLRLLRQFHHCIQYFTKRITAPSESNLYG